MVTRMSCPTLLLLAVVLGVGGCWGGVPGGTGRQDEGCVNSFLGNFTCEHGLVCDAGTCRACGDVGERCCSFNRCDDGNACRSNGGRRTCGDCGQIGEACCPSDSGLSCETGARCDRDLNICEAPFTDPCTGSTPRVFWGRGADGCALPASFSAIVSVDDFGIAEQCARAILGVSDVRLERPQLFDTCEAPPFGFCEEQRRWAYSVEDAERCAQAVCGAGCPVVIGDCPPDGTGICM